MFLVNILNFNKKLQLKINSYNKKIKAKFKYADKLKIPYVAVIGEDEINSGKLTLKNMETGEQFLISVNELNNFVK